jgi:hypothetical protein
MTDDTTIVLVQCTSAKRSGVHPARRLYDESAYFRKQRRYADAVGDAWFIQSAKYALVHPNTSIGSYDQHANDLDHRAEWARRVADRLERRHGPPAAVEILGGQAYHDPLADILRERGYAVETPLSGKRIGERMAWLDEQASHD